MKRDVFSEALLATARIACCVSLLGCPKPATTTAADTTTAQPAAEEPSPEVFFDGLPAPTITISDTCAEQITSFVDATSSVEDLRGAPEAVKACCVEVIAQTEIGDSRQNYGQCCEIADTYDGMCYPWGPPRPPEQGVAAREAHDRAMAVRTAANGGTAPQMLDLRAAAQALAPAVTARSETLRRIAVTTWTGRMLNEHESHHVFLALADRLEAAGVDAAEVARCREFADEERRHGALCGAVVEALGGEARAGAPDGGPMPLHTDASAVEAMLRDVLSICCLSETIAVALIGAERLEMPEGALRELLTEIYADECGHANFGWRLLPTLLPDDAALKARLSDYLRTALAHLEAHELAHIPARQAPKGGEALGLCSGTDARALFYAAVEQVILPGLESHGLAAREAWAQRHAA